MNPIAIVFDGALWVAIPVALLAGLVSFLSPCVLPLVPGYLGFIGGAVAPRTPVGSAMGARGAVSPVIAADPARVAASATATVAASATATAAVSAPTTASVRTAAAPAQTVEAAPARGRLLGGVLLFIAGFTLVFVTIAVLGGTLGGFFFANGELITRVLGVVVIALGLVFIGLFGFAQRTYRPALQGNLGLIGAPLLGIAMGIGWTPCIGPTLSAIIALSWNMGDPGRAALLGVAYSLGLGIPFLLITLGFGWATRSVTFLRRHIRVVNIIGGALLIALGVLMVTGVWTDIMSRLGAVMTSVELPL